MSKSDRATKWGSSGGWITSGRWLGALAVVAIALTVIALNRPNTPFQAQSTASGPHADPTVAGIPVEMTYGDCGTGWTGGPAGRTTFALWNSSGGGMEVYLENAATKQVYLDVEALGNNVTRSASVTLGPGSYRFYCVPDDTAPSLGATVQVTGSTSLPVTPGLVPITSNDLRPLLDKYQSWVASQLPVLVSQVQTLDTDIEFGDVVKARADWLIAHHTYQTLGGAYDAFGSYGDAIDGLPATLTTARKDPHLHGFHKIEGLLWPVGHSAPASTIAPYAGGLVKATEALQKAFGHGLRMSPIDLGLRAHEILEDAILHTLTGQDDDGSHAGLQTIDANITGTYQALDALAPVLKTTDPAWTETQHWLARSRTLVQSYDHDGSWTSLQSLTRAQREELNATLTETVELLSRVAVMTDPRPAAG